MEIKPQWWRMRLEYFIWTSISPIHHSKDNFWTSMPILSQSKSYYWTSMPILSHYNSYYWTSMPTLSQSEKLLYVLSHPARLLSRESNDFWIFGTYPFSKSVYFPILKNFSKNGSPGQTIMLMRRAAKFWVEPRSPFSKIFHHDPKTSGKPLIIVS